MDVRYSRVDCSRTLDRDEIAGSCPQREQVVTRTMAFDLYWMLCHGGVGLGQISDVSMDPSLRREGVVGPPYGDKMAVKCEDFDDVIWLHIVINCDENNSLLSLRGVSRRLRSLVDGFALYWFKKEWGIQKLCAEPESPVGYLRCDASKFVVKYDLNSKMKSGRARSLQSLALEWGTEPALLKRMNNMYSESPAMLASREYVLVPVGVDERMKENLKIASFERCGYSCRTWVVLYPMQEDKAPRAEEDESSENENRQATDLIVEMFQKTVLTDYETASYYLDEAGGSFQRAVELFREDTEWDKKMKHLRRSLRKAVKATSSRRN